MLPLGVLSNCLPRAFVQRFNIIEKGLEGFVNASKIISLMHPCRISDPAEAG
jgi:hypothetical protein